MRRILVTGGAGFVGSHLALGLKSAFEPCEVSALDNLHRRGAELNLPRLDAGGVRFIKGDVRSMESLRSAGKFDLLVECSAEPSVQAGLGSDTSYLTGTNLQGAINCAELCRGCDAPMIFLSTSRVYPIAPQANCEYKETPTRFVLSDYQKVSGLSSKGLSEDFPIDGVRSLYGATKYAAEIMLADYGSAFGFPVVINRCGVIAGAWQMGKADQGIAAFWAASHLLGRKLRYIGFGGTGRQVRDFLHIDDLLRLVIMQANSPEPFAQTGAFNVGGGLASSASLIELSSLCEAATGVKLEIGSDPQTRYADVPIYITDNSRIESFCQWRPERGMGDIVDDIVRWLKDSPEALKTLSQL